MISWWFVQYPSEKIMLNVIFQDLRGFSANVQYLTVFVHVNLMIWKLRAFGFDLWSQLVPNQWLSCPLKLFKPWTRPIPMPKSCLTDLWYSTKSKLSNQMHCNPHWYSAKCQNALKWPLCTNLSIQDSIGTKLKI